MNELNNNLFQKGLLALKQLNKSDKLLRQMRSNREWMIIDSTDNLKYIHHYMIRMRQLICNQMCSMATIKEAYTKK